MISIRFALRRSGILRQAERRIAFLMPIKSGCLPASQYSRNSRAWHPVLRCFHKPQCVSWALGRFTSRCPEPWETNSPRRRRMWAATWCRRRKRPLRNRLGRAARPVGCLSFSMGREFRGVRPHGLWKPAQRCNLGAEDFDSPPVAEWNPHAGDSEHAALRNHAVQDGALPGMWQEGVQTLAAGLGCPRGTRLFGNSCDGPRRPKIGIPTSLCRVLRRPQTIASARAWSISRGCRGSRATRSTAVLGDSSWTPVEGLLRGVGALSV